MTAVPATTSAFLTTLSAAVDYYLKQRWPESERPCNRTYASAKSRLEALQQTIGNLQISELSYEQMAAEMSRYLHLRRFSGLSDVSVDNDRRVISAMMTWLSAEGLLAFHGNPCDRKTCRTAKPATRCKRPLSDEEVTLLLKVSRDTALYPAILLCLGACLRPIGASRVKGEHFDLEQRTVWVREKNRERVIPLSDWFIQELTTWLESHSYHNFHQDAATHMFEELRKKHHLPAYFTLQGLRRTCLFRMWKSGTPPQMAAALAGNSVEVIEKHYAEFKAMNAIEYVNCLTFS